MPNNQNELPVTKMVEQQHAKFANRYKVDLNDLNNKKPIGLSGFLRVREEGWLISACVESIIDYLDELIIVYCTSEDNTAEESLRMQELYPDKVKVYHYEPEVFPPYTFEHFLTPPDSPYSLINLNNYALEKTNYRYVLKHDADHLTFSTFQQIREALFKKRSTIYYSAYWLLRIFIRSIQKGLLLTGHNHLSLPRSIRRLLNNLYMTSVTYLFRDKNLLAISGINIGYKKNDRFYLFDSYPTAGHGDYGICRRESIKFEWSSNYERTKNPIGAFVGFTFWHIRIKKREGAWQLYNKYTPFRDESNKLSFPDINKCFDTLRVEYKPFIQEKYSPILKQYLILHSRLWSLLSPVGFQPLKTLQIRFYGPTVGSRHPGRFKYCSIKYGTLF